MCLCSVSLENVLLDVRDLGRGMDLVRRECGLHDHAVLKGFLQTSDPQLDKLQKDAKTAEVLTPVQTLYITDQHNSSQYRSCTLQPRREVKIANVS